MKGWRGEWSSDEAFFMRPVDPKLTDDRRRADLCGADLSNVHLDGAQLDGALLDGANLTIARLHGVHLTSADLTNATLEDAGLTGAQVSKTKLAGVDLTGATYAPVSEPPDPYVAGIKGLATLKACFEPTGVLNTGNVDDETFTAPKDVKI